jgi:uncharacterized membrane protein
MAVVTYATRLAGLPLARRLPRSPGFEAWLGAIPGTILIAIVAPALVNSGPRQALAGLATLLVAWRSRNLLLAITAGAVTAALLRLL